ncbi:glycosyltransferase family 4 protein [Chloroflexota bacterium]
MKICLLNYRGNMYCGGQGVYMYYLCRELLALGHEVHAIVGPPYPELPDGVTLHKLDGLDLFLKKKDIFPKGNPFGIFKPFNLYELITSRMGHFNEMFTFSVKAFLKLKDLLPKHRFDVIHDNQTLGYGLLMMKTLNVPIVATIHHPLPIDTKSDLSQITGIRSRFKRAIMYPPFMQGIVARRLDMVITDSKASANDIRQIFKVKLDKTRVVYCGVDTSKFSPNGYVKEPNKLIMVGRTDDRKKGVIYVLKALKMIKDGCDVNLTIVDEVYPFSVACLLAEKYDITDRVTFTGRISTDKLVEHYGKSEIAITSSIYEGFGLPAAEAMSCQIPVIATTGGALPEVVKHGHTGILVPPANASALANAILQLVDDEPLRKQLGKAGRKRVKGNFTWQRTAQATADVYREAIAKLH